MLCRDGPQVSLDHASASPLLLVHEGEGEEQLAPLTLESSGGFSSARANVCVFAGKWQYEVVLRTTGARRRSWGWYWAQQGWFVQAGRLVGAGLPALDHSGGAAGIVGLLYRRVPHVACGLRVLRGGLGCMRCDAASLQCRQNAAGGAGLRICGTLTHCRHLARSGPPAAGPAIVYPITWLTP